MSIINSIVQFVMDMGGGIFLPFTITVLGLIFKIKLFDSLRNGLRVGAGFLGINVILNMLVSRLQPAIDYYSTKGNGSRYRLGRSVCRCMVHILCAADCSAGYDLELYFD